MEEATPPFVAENFFSRAKGFVVRNAWWLSAMSFVVGFYFDSMTLGRIDNWINLAQQGIVLIVLGAVLGIELLFKEGVLAPPASAHGRRLWELRLLITQFFFGSLMSAYAVFYFKSASLIGTFIFLPVLVILMVLVSTGHFRRGAIALRMGVYSLCVSSYFAYLVPIVLGKLGAFPFLIAMTLAASSLGLLYFVIRHGGMSARGANRGVA